MVERRGDRSRQVRRVGEADTVAVEAWRSTSGHTLIYFLPDDRRAHLDPGVELSDITDERLATLYAESTPITDTERRFVSAKGRAWLAQATGPVWAESGSAAGATGILFTSLEGPFERIVRDDVSPGWLKETERLPELLASGIGSPQAGVEPGE